MSDFIVAPLSKHLWYKRTWGIILIIIGATTLVFLAWFGWLVYDNVQRIKSGALKPITGFDSEFTKGTNKKKNVLGTPELVPATSPMRGAPDGAITIVQFGDFQCPFSAKEFPIIRPIMENASRIGIKFVYRDFPLIDIHPDAFKAAEASHCAQEQGRYWAYHDQLFLNQTDLSEAALKKYAESVGLDVAKFEVCLKSGTYQAQVARDLQDGLALGVRGTPTFFINGLKIEGAIPKTAWDAILERLKSL
ncbi:MAG: hypothetical protein A3C15_00980 [Candidatus Magasanikbacteria bacterium RIFCSPHIGHO2_02_FULL_50_9b]|uniref:Thioredoxin domain-containing protein n=1 Tax=Candidatus Magasanikbacteria bacterium RIFCSPHIGHO2_02_FULL_50_9b TaxID=1798682 RepID=A0A1F6M956_9BACT|nr:MAG: hypothetical protein A3C15_00980 [Candidatus Magasanikbacteria bacterium RIFCSPHIGHO2_02_FULL_50_9b]